MVRRDVLFNLHSLEDFKSRAWWQARIARYFFPLGLTLAVTMGLAWPEPGRSLSSHKVGNYRISTLVFLDVIFVVAGLTYKPEQGWQVLKRPAGLAYGLITTLAITPMLSFALAHIPFDDPTYATGLAVFFATPTTLSVCKAFVVSAGGNSAIALMIAVASNFLGVATVPWVVRAVFGRTVLVLRESMAKFLAFHVAAPLGVGCALQLIGPRVRGFAEKRFTGLTLLSNGCIMLKLWTTCSRSREALSSATARDLAVVVAVSLGAHALYLALNFLCARFVLRLPRKQLIAVVIAGSEKTIGISATLAKDLRPRVFGESSLLLAPGLIAHICQMFMDSLVVELINVFKSDVPRHERAGASERSQEAHSEQNGAVHPS